MSTVVQANNTYTKIESMARRLTASPGESTWSTADFQEMLNTFYNNDFPYAIKLDQMRSVYTFYTEPNRDTYPLDVNYNQGIRSPVYVDGVSGYFFKDRDQFFNMWPRWPTQFKPISGDGTTSMFNFTVPGPFLPKMVTLGGVAVAGNPISVADDGNGNLLLEVPNPVVSVPLETAVYTAPPLAPSDPLVGKPIAGMKNLNTLNPGNNLVTIIGSVNYVTGAFSISFPAGFIPISGQQMILRVSQYQTGRPYSLLFWNNQFTIRPIPKFIHKIEVESYLTPVQFMLSTDSPILNQWVQYLAYGVSCERLRQQQDVEGLQNIMEGFKRQEALVLERQGVEEINQRNTTLYAGTQQTQGWNNGWMSGGY